MYPHGTAARVLTSGHPRETIIKVLTYGHSPGHLKHHGTIGHTAGIICQSFRKKRKNDFTESTRGKYIPQLFSVNSHKWNFNKEIEFSTKIQRVE